MKTNFCLILEGHKVTQMGDTKELLKKAEEALDKASENVLTDTTEFKKQMKVHSDTVEEIIDREKLQNEKDNI